jgi:hypothetical protein
MAHSNNAGCFCKAVPLQWCGPSCMHNNIMKPPIVISRSNARRILISLVVLEVLMVILYLADKWIPDPNYINESWFNMDGERNVPAIFSAIQLFTVGLALFFVGLTISRDSEFSPAIIYFLGLGFVFLAIDEGFRIHEIIQMSYRRGKMGEIGSIIPRVKKHYGVWLTIYLTSGTLLFLVLIRPLIRFWRTYPKSAFIIGFGFTVFLVGAAGVEIIAYNYFWGDGSIAKNKFGVDLAKFYYFHLIALEEFLEMLGISIVLYGVLLINSVHAKRDIFEEKKAGT